MKRSFSLLIKYTEISTKKHLEQLGFGHQFDSKPYETWHLISGTLMYKSDND